MEQPATVASHRAGFVKWRVKFSRRNRNCPVLEVQKEFCKSATFLLWGCQQNSLLFAAKDISVVSWIKILIKMEAQS